MGRVLRLLLTNDLNHPMRPLLIATFCHLCAWGAGDSDPAWIVYRYALWLQRLERRFRHVNPRKFEVSFIVCFYLPILMAIAVAGLGPRLRTGSAPTPLTEAVGFFLVPVLFAGAAGIIRGTYL